MTKTLNMTQGKPFKLLFSFAMPLMFGNMFQQLYTVTDTAIVGQGVGLNALAALGSVDWLNWMMLGIAQGFTQGCAVRISQKFGEGDHDGLRHVVGQSACLTALIAIGCTLLAHAGLPLFFFLLHVPEEVSGLASIYTRILFTGLPAVFFYNYCSAVLRAVGDSQTPLKAMVIASITNIVLDSVTVFVLHWGIAGAALATVFSQCLSGCICAGKIWKTPELHFTRDDLNLDPALSKNLVWIGVPVAAKNVIIAIGGMIVTATVNYFTMSFIAGFTATNKLFGLLEIAGISYGYAVTTYVGQNLGAGKLDRIKSGMRSATILSVGTSFLIAAFMITFGRSITMLFISSDVPELMAAAGDTAYQYLVVLCIFLPILYLLHTYLAALQGLGNTVLTMNSGIVELCMRILVSLIVGYTGYEIGIYGAEIAAWFGAAAYLMVNYFKIMNKALKDAENA